MYVNDAAVHRYVCYRQVCLQCDVDVVVVFCHNELASKVTHVDNYDRSVFVMYFTIFRNCINQLHSTLYRMHRCDVDAL